MDGLYLKITQDFTPDAKEARFGGKDSPMAVEKGDIIFDVRKRGDGWMYGKNLNSGKVGKFPESCAAKLTGNNKNSSGSGSPDSEKNDDKKPVVKNESVKEKPAWLQSRTTTPTAKKTPLYPKPFAGNIRQPQEKEKEERKETSGDSGVVEDSPDGNYCNDDEKPTNRDASKTGNTVKDDKQAEPKTVPRSLQTFHKQKPEAKATETEKEPAKAIGKPFRLNLSKSSEGTKPTEPVSRLYSKYTPRNFQRSLPTPEKDNSNEDENYEPVEKSEEKRPRPKEAPKAVKPKEEPKTADIKTAKINPTDKVGEKNQSNVTNTTSAGGAGVNIQENPLSKDEGSIYQVPNIGGPPKPARSSVQGCSECNEPHIYDTPMHYKTPPSSPSTTDKRDNYEPTVEKKQEKQKEGKNKTKGGSTSLKPTSSVIRKTKEQMKHRMASYESIELEGRRSTESIKDAVLAAKETKEKLLTPNKRPKIRILLGMLLGLLLGVFIFLTLYLLAHLHVVVCVVSALIIGIVVATVFGFLDRTRLQCIALLVFPSLFASGGKISFWLLITFFIVSGPMCNFIDNVRIVAHSRGCLMNTDDLADNSSVKLPGFVMLDGNNRDVVQRVQKYENISHALQNYINDSLRLSSSSDRGDNASRDNNSSGVICMNFLRRAHNICSAEVDSVYRNCTRLTAKKNCDSLTPRNACNHLFDAPIRETCEHINTANSHTLWHIKKILEASPERMKTREIPPDVNDNTVITTGEPCEFVKILAMMLPLLALVVLYEAYRYHKLYLSCNEFDNHFLTLRFKSIEDMRKSSGAADLLVPLKKAELQRFVQPTGCQLAESEKRNMLKYLLLYFIYLIFALMAILLDHYFYVVVTNEEPQSNISKSCINGDLKRLDMMYVIILSTLLGVLLLIILLQAFILRLRRLITSRFYPRRERKRIAYLYYKLLEERKTFYKSVIENMNNFSEETETLNKLDVVLVLCNNFSWIKAVFEVVGINIRRCAVCGTGLNKKYLYCDTEDCDVIYCRTCFWDLENKCLGCMRNSKMTSRSSSLSGQSQRRKNDYVKPV